MLIYIYRYMYAHVTFYASTMVYAEVHVACSESQQCLTQKIHLSHQFDAFPGSTSVLQARELPGRVGRALG